MSVRMLPSLFLFCLINLFLTGCYATSSKEIARGEATPNDGDALISCVGDECNSEVELDEEDDQSGHSIFISEGVFQFNWEYPDEAEPDFAEITLIREIYSDYVFGVNSTTTVVENANIGLDTSYEVPWVYQESYTSLTLTLSVQMKVYSDGGEQVRDEGEPLVLTFRIAYQGDDLCFTATESEFEIISPGEDIPINKPSNPNGNAQGMVSGDAGQAAGPGGDEDPGVVGGNSPTLETSGCVELVGEGIAVQTLNMQAIEDMTNSLPDF